MKAPYRPTTPSSNQPNVTERLMTSFSTFVFFLPLPPFFTSNRGQSERAELIIGHIDESSIDALMSSEVLQVAILSSLSISTLSLLKYIQCAFQDDQDNGCNVLIFSDKAALFRRRGSGGTYSPLSLIAWNKISFRSAAATGATDATDANVMLHSHLGK